MATLENKAEIKKKIRLDFDSISAFAKTAGLDEIERQYLYATLDGSKFYKCIIPVLNKHGYVTKVGGYRNKQRAA